MPVIRASAFGHPFFDGHHCRRHTFRGTRDTFGPRGCPQLVRLRILPDPCLSLRQVSISNHQGDLFVSAQRRGTQNWIWRKLGSGALYRKPNQCRATSHISEPRTWVFAAVGARNSPLLIHYPEAPLGVFS